MTLVAVVGFEDPLRDNVVESIKKITEANTNVRLVSGDHKWTAIETANMVGIPADPATSDPVIISGEELKSQLEVLMKKSEDTEEGRGETWTFINEASVKEFKDNILQFVVVVYRADSVVKHMFTAAIR